MLPGNLPRPLLSLIFEPVASIRNSDEDAVGSLWSVFTKVSNAMSDGQRLENMTWRLWHRAYTRRTATMRHSTPTGDDSDLNMRRTLLLSPSLSFSSSSEATSNSSDWDRDTAVGDSEGSIPKSYNHTRSESVQHTSVISPYLEGVDNSPIVQATISSPAPSVLAETLPRPLKGVDTCTRESPMAPSLDSSPRVVQDSDAGVRSEIAQFLDKTSPVSHHQHQSVFLSQSNTREYSSSHDLSTLQISQGGYDVEGSISISSSPIPSRKQNSPDPADHPAVTEVSPAIVSSTRISTALPESLTVGKLISRMLAGTIVLTKPLQQSISDSAGILQCSDSVYGKRECMSPRVQIIVPPESPSLNPNSALTSAASTPRQTFPTVVVVNPTPHPTPPATPSIEATEKTFVLSPSTVAVIPPPRLALDVNIAGTTLSPSRNNTQLATPVSLGKHSNSLNDHVTLEIPGQRLSGSVVPESVVFTASTNTSLSSRLSGTGNLIALPDRPMNSSDIASHLPTPAAELTPDMSNGTSKAINVPIQAATPAVTSEDKKFFLAMPHSGSHGSGHDSTESPDSFGTDGIDVRRRDTALGSPLLNLRDSFPRPQIPSRREEEMSSSFSASSPAGHPPSITSSRGGGVSRLKSRATFTVSSGGGRRKGSSKKSVKDVYKREIEKRLSSTDNQPVDESVESKERRSLKGKEVDAIERSAVVPSLSPPPASAGTNNAVGHVPRVKTMHNLLPLSRLNNNTEHQINLRQLPTNPPRRPASPFRQHDARPNAPNGGGPAEPPQANQQRVQYNPQLVGHLGLGHLPTIPPRPRRQIEITETSSDYSTTDTGDDSWESDSGSVEEKKENISNGHSSSKGRRSNLSKGEKMRHSNNRQRDPGESVRDAALEAQRQRDMFQKLPPRTYSNLGQLPRTKSGLSMLFRPDPELVPAGHPYRTSRSSQDLLARNWSIPALPLAMTAIQQRAFPVAPIEANVTASSVKSKEVNGSIVTSLPRRSSAAQAQHNGGGYRPRGKPADQEEESDSDDPDDRIPLPNSVAERRLAALVRRGSRSQVHSPSTSQKQSSKIQVKGEVQADSSQTVVRTATMPVLPHQFLEPAPLQTPHEIRRRIISEELDEELRRNLLWERSQNQIPGRPPRQNGSILPGPWRTLTMSKVPPPEAPQSTRPPSEPHVESQIQNTENPSKSQLFSTQRTKSWAGEYHATGCKLSL
ncbi:hypothetical protein Clacol_002548 [Clathrus columnatus]|uniref:Nitrogen regulatory protein areA GATA-like domain-containing protein n=1 Tax=Clathrus columnatus TaxID=1419009 RepID=A0AAV5A4F8_9AGAM|nr:hypothetical protein Clacol_002548 [Clathrus columnatus]